MPVKSLKLYSPKIITQGSSNCGGAPDCQGCLFMPRNRSFLLHLTFTYCFIFQSPEHLPTFLSIVGMYDGKNNQSIPISLLVVANLAIQIVLSEVELVPRWSCQHVWSLNFGH